MSRKCAYNEDFDLIFMHATFEHIPPEHLKTISKQVDEKLKKGGFLVICRTPNKYAWTEYVAKFFSQAHQHKYTKNEIIKYFDEYRLIFYEKTDFFPEVSGGFFQKIINFFYPLTNIFEKIIKLTPFRIISHHHFIILKKD